MHREGSNEIYGSLEATNHKCSEENLTDTDKESITRK